MKTDVKALTLPELTSLLTGLGQPAYRAAQLYGWLHRRRVCAFEEMTDLPRELRALLCERFTLTALRELRHQVSRRDGTEKLLLALPDGNAVEAVLMRYKYGNTACISTQVGCRMGCRFCASTLGGLARNLTPGEMLDEVYALERFCGRKVHGVA